MTLQQTAPPADAWTLPSSLFKECLVRYGTNPLFVDSEEWTFESNPYRRPVRPQVLRYMDFETPLTRDQILDYSSLAANRLLLNVYEHDLVFLPEEGFDGIHDDFGRFYAPETRALAEVIRPVLERHVFSFLDDEVDVSGRWTRAELEAYLVALPEEAKKADNVAVRTIRESSNPHHAAVTYMIQFAGDFLSEASAMARNLLGNYGPAQSELFKIVIDEYGYGVHDTKHSTLFERLLTSIGLAPKPHAYWQFYLTSSLLLNNYFHFVCKNHDRFFRYLGALYYTEATLSDICDRVGRLLREVFGPDADLRYFGEHVHIDEHHGRMALDKIIRPVLDLYGDAVIPEIVRGVEEFRLLAEIADDDFAAQVAWSDGGPRYKSLHDPVYDAIAGGRVECPVQRFVEPRGELSVTHVHDGDELCHIVSGTMRFVTGHDRYELLHGGEGTVIRSNRLHGAIIESEECVYDIHSIGDYEKCLSSPVT
ncbi:MAG TPA: iron-containing redox enzyme family protein [Actinomycetota bacterium]|nr:iron-containing redox enzyme family protein [Actinomycetota bacterium]